MMGSMQMRLHLKKEVVEQQLNTNLINKYLDQHTKLTQQMAVDYKREAFVDFITEMYCKDARKYTGKNRDLIERALFGNAEWLKLKDKLREQMEKKMTNIEDDRLPPNITKTIQRLYEHFCRFMEIKDIDK